MGPRKNNPDHDTTSVIRCAYSNVRGQNLDCVPYICQGHLFANSHQSSLAPTGVCVPDDERRRQQAMDDFVSAEAAAASPHFVYALESIGLAFFPATPPNHMAQSVRKEIATGEIGGETLKLSSVGRILVLCTTDMITLRSYVGVAGVDGAYDRYGGFKTHSGPSATRFSTNDSKALHRVT